jgi:hypothetical protein
MGTLLDLEASRPIRLRLLREEGSRVIELGRHLGLAHFHPEVTATTDTDSIASELESDVEYSSVRRLW